MRITDIKINNYRAFYGEHHISLDNAGKNLMVYGENGSGKSALYTAFNDFLESSIAKVKLEENIFVPKDQKNTVNIKVYIKESPDSSSKSEIELNISNGEIIGAEKILIADANKIKGLFDYRSLLRTHLYFDDKVDLFKILVEDILYHSINRFSKEEGGKEWAAIYDDT